VADSTRTMAPVARRSTYIGPVVRGTKRIPLTCLRSPTAGTYSVAMDTGRHVDRRKTAEIANGARACTARRRDVCWESPAEQALLAPGARPTYLADVAVLGGFASRRRTDH